MDERVVPIVLIAGVLPVLISLLALGLRAARLYEGPAVALVAVTLGALCLLVPIAAIVVAGRTSEAQLSTHASVLELEWRRNTLFIDGTVVRYATLATLPGLLLGALAFARSKRKGAGGWMLIGLTALLWLGGVAFELRRRPPVRYPPDADVTWTVAIALETNSCPTLEQGLRWGARDGSTARIPPELSWHRLADVCVLERLQALEGRPLDGDWLRRRHELATSPMLVDPSLRVRVAALAAGAPRWTGAAVASSEPLRQHVTKRLLESRQAIHDCFLGAPAGSSVAIELVISGKSVDQLRPKTPGADPAITRCLMEVLAHATFDHQAPVALEFTFVPSGGGIMLRSP